jgi:hypothetical protein
MSRIAQVTHGKSGQAAISAGVQDFERPADPSPEIQRDTIYYNALHNGRLSHPFHNPGSGGPNAVGNNPVTATQGNLPPGKSSKTVGNVFAECKVVGQGPGSGIPVVGGAVGTFTGFFTGQTEGGLLCYVTGVLKVSAMGLAGVALMGVGLYLMLPRYRSKVNAATLGVASRGASLLPAARAERAATAATTARHTAHREASQRADLRTKRARARTEEARARKARYEAPATRYSLSSQTEDRIKRAQAKGSSRRPDRVA